MSVRVFYAGIAVVFAGTVFAGLASLTGKVDADAPLWLIAPYAAFAVVVGAVVFRLLLESRSGS